MIFNPTFIIFISYFTDINCGTEPLHDKLENGKIVLPTNNETYYGAEITYECEDGYTIARGTQIRSCGSDAKWTGTTPQCLSKYIDKKNNRVK